MKTTTNREYFAYQIVTSTVIFLLLAFIASSGARSMIARRHPEPEGLMLFLMILIFLAFFIVLLFHMVFFRIPAAKLDSQYFIIKKTLFQRAKRIQLKDISDIKYDGDYLNITYTHDAQQVSDKFDLSRLFYEDTRRCLIQDLSEALKKHGITSKIQGR